MVLSPPDLVYIMIPSVVIILIVAAISRRWETREKTIPTADPELRAQRDAVVRTWLRKPFPDW